jgi:hypothetical protein
VLLVENWEFEGARLSHGVVLAWLSWLFAIVDLVLYLVIGVLLMIVNRPDAFITM